MRRRIVIGKPLMMTIFRLCREGERSVDFSLQDRWEKFQAYYHEPKRQEICQVLELLQGKVGCNRQPPSEPILEESCNKRRVWYGLHGRYFTNQWCATWSVPAAELCYIAKAFGRLYGLLNELEKPIPERLVETRMQLCFCQDILKSHISGMKELALLDVTEHFNQAPHMEERRRQLEAPFRARP